MITSFPEEFTCSPALRQMYPVVEKRMDPYIKAKSRKLASSLPGVDYDDAVQEGRMALLFAISKFDFNKTDGQFEAYMGRVLVNTYNALIYQTLTQVKVPYVYARDESGGWIKRPSFPISLDNMLTGDDHETYSYDPPDIEGMNPEQVELNQQFKTEVGKFTMKMYNRLNGFDLEVFRCKVHPPMDFLHMLYDDGVDFVYRDVKGELVMAENFVIKSTQIAKYLDSTKNAVDWALHKAKKLFTTIAKYDEEFSDLYGDMVENKGWPMIHMSKGKHEHLKFRRRIFVERKLDTKQSKPEVFQCSKKKDANGKPYWSRTIREYSWGCVVVLKRDAEYVTLVLEGRFNALYGEVWGANGTREGLPIKWYGALVRGLKDG